MNKESIIQEENEEDQQQYEDKNEATSSFSLKDLNLREYLMLTFFSFEFNISNYLQDLSPNKATQIENTLAIAPGYKPIQLVFIHYLLKTNFFIAYIMAFLYPLPYTLLFIVIGKILVSEQGRGIFQNNSNIQTGFEIILMGVRCGLLAILIKYCWHYPAEKYHWIMYGASIFIAFFFRSNYVYYLLYGLGIFLAYYRKQDGADYNDENSRRKSEGEINSLKDYQQLNSKSIETYPTIAITTLCIMLLASWILVKYFDYEEYHFLWQFMLIGMLKSGQQSAIFFPFLAVTMLTSITIYSADPLGISMIIPGPQLKSYFILLGQYNTLLNYILAYIAIYTPSILLSCIFVADKTYFSSEMWLSINKSIQFISNGLIIITVIDLLEEESCRFNVICYTTIVLCCVAALYKFKEISTSLLGIFLVTSRALVLHFNKGIPLEEFLCQNIPKIA